jgi:hypothetical protein
MRDLRLPGLSSLLRVEVKLNAAAGSRLELTTEA